MTWQTSPDVVNLTKVDNSIDLVVLNLFGEVSPVLVVMLTVRQAGGVVPGPHLAAPHPSQEQTQHHHLLLAQPRRPDREH